MGLGESLDLSLSFFPNVNHNVATWNQSTFFLIFTITCLFHWLIEDRQPHLNYWGIQGQALTFNNPDNK